MLFLLFLAEVASAQLPLDSVDHVRLGDTKESVQAAWRELGPIDENKEDDGTVRLSAATNSATLCRGRVVIASREISERFNDFASFAQALIEVHGPATPEVFAVNGERSDPDPRFPTMMETAVIRLRWEKAPNYMLQFYEINGATRTVETLAGPNPCSSDE